MKILLRTLCLVSCLALFVSGCKNENAAKHSRPLIVTTTGMIADGLRNMAGVDADVKELMGPGVDPHLYKASQGDLKLLEEADYIFYNGIHLEGKMAEVLEKLAKKKPCIAIGNALDKSELRQMQQQADTWDPHIWFDVMRWSKAIGFAGDTLAGLMPEKRDSIRMRKTQYLERLARLDAEIRKDMEAVPSDQRILITAHDAFGYFGMAYGMEVRGLQGISTVSEFGLRDVRDMADLITSKKIKSVFVESSVPEKYIRSVIEGCAENGHTVKVGGMLYSDAMGQAGTPEGSYEGMVRHNVKTIVEGLQ